jgi:hypothetical protein
MDRLPFGMGRTAVISAARQMSETDMREEQVKSGGNLPPIRVALDGIGDKVH